MDNFQRTEHFLSYCPKLIGVSENLSQKESTKRLSRPALKLGSFIVPKIEWKNYLKRIVRKHSWQIIWTQWAFEIISSISTTRLQITSASVTKMLQSNLILNISLFALFSSNFSDESEPRCLLTRLPSLKLNSNKSLGAFSELSEIESKTSGLYMLQLFRYFLILKRSIQI